MQPSREGVRGDVLELLHRLADDWEYSGRLDDETRLLGDLEFESLDIVVLCTAVQEHYDRVLPFQDFFAEVGQREERDVTVGEWVDFIHRHLAAPTCAAGPATQPASAGRPLGEPPP